MSYARWGCDGSDVYVYATKYPDRDNKGRVVERWVCQHWVDEGGPPSFYAKTHQEMIDHLLGHRERGDTVPESAFERLREEMKS